MRRVMEETVRSLTEHLALMNPQQRAAMVSRYPKAWATRPRPQTLRQLAARLIGKAEPRAEALPLGELQLLEAAVALADHPRPATEPSTCDRAALSRLVGVGASVTEQRVNDLLDSLTRWSLAWPDGDRIMLHPLARKQFFTPLGRRPVGDPPMPERAPLLPSAPVPSTHSAPRQPGAGSNALDQVDRILAAFTPPWKSLKKGGVSAADVRRAGRLLDCPPDEVRLWIYLADRLGLITETYGRWVCTPKAETWRGTPPSDQLLHLISAWSGLPALPLFELPDTKRPGHTVPVLNPVAALSAAVDQRRTVLAVLEDLPPGCGTQLGPELAHVVYYRRPCLFAPRVLDPDHAPASGDACASWRLPRPALDAELVTRTVVREAELLGLVADGALTDLGRALLSAADEEALCQAVAAALPLHNRAAVLADHTALVPGIPTPPLARLLASVCDLERKEAHSQSWRITPASIRRFFDDHPGTDPEDLLVRLADASTTPLPQTVTYLVRDTAARHGHITVSAAQSVLDVRSEALATELVHHSDLRHLRLRQVAPTVLLASARTSTVLTALREAGYTPADKPDSAPSAQPPAATKATEESTLTAPRPFGTRTGRPAKSLPRWLSELPDDRSTNSQLSPLARLIHEQAPALGPVDCTALAEAIEAGTTVHIEYQDYGLQHTTATVTGPHLNDQNAVAGPRKELPYPVALKKIQLVLPRQTPRSQEPTTEPYDAGR